MTRDLREIYIVIVDHSGEVALSIREDVGSEAFSELMRERYLLTRLVGEAGLGCEVAGEIEDGRKINIRKKYE